MKTLLRGGWRLIQPLRNTRGPKFWRLPGAYLRYWREWHKFRAMGGRADFNELHPIFFDDNPASQSGGGHYFYQDIWALNAVARFRPEEHHDVGSRLDGFVGQVTAVCPVIFWDIRPPRVQLPRFEFRPGSILALPIPDQEIKSLSCLHTAEHIGLGRYGDLLDPEGTAKALQELSRVLAPGGQLLFSMPVGRERVCFNAQRIWHPERPLDVMRELKLLEFAAVTDADEYLTDLRPGDLASAQCACGLYRMTRG
jgi:SAM-dependent methyltransferase